MFRLPERRHVALHALTTCGSMVWQSTTTTTLGRCSMAVHRFCVFFFQAEDGIRDLTVTGVQTCALPIFEGLCRILVPNRSDSQQYLELPRHAHHRAYRRPDQRAHRSEDQRQEQSLWPRVVVRSGPGQSRRTTEDRKSTRLNSSHSQISYAVFCLKKKNNTTSDLKSSFLK